MGAEGTSRVVEQSTGFMFVGRGNGHGLGLSQWGAKGMADAGYDYRQILQHYYQNVTIVKE
ncbi:Amidase enhancer precursor [compost metagenome]